MARGTRDDSSTRRVILESAVSLIDEVGGDGLRVSDVARRACVGVPTVYYYFTSRDALVAEAQEVQAERIIVGRRDVTGRWRAALEADDERAFYEALRDYHQATRDPSSTERMWTLVAGLVNSRTNEGARRRLVEINDAALAEREAILREAQARGWLRADVDPRAWIALTAATVVGQVLLEGSTGYDIDGATWHALMWRLIGVRTWAD